MSNNNFVEVPDYYDNLEQTLDTADRILSNAVDNSNTLFHTLVVSCFNGLEISSRVMVLREFCLQKKIMRFHTDYRSAKIRELKDQTSANVIGYDPALKVQIKLQGEIKVHYDDSVTQDAWQSSTNRSKKCYSVKDGSSNEIENPNEYDIKEFEPEEGYKNFSVLIFSFNSLEYLYLKRSGHRRAIHKWDDKLNSKWLVP
tara:strand:- start:1482 stop:2081 length:600 start_codon:yes stop_codon:yes gene_type:complete